MMKSGCVPHGRKQLARGNLTPRSQRAGAGAGTTPGEHSSFGSIEPVLEEQSEEGELPIVV
jgi:hypothetical protein